MHTLLYIKQIANKVLLYSTENSTPYSVMTYIGKEFKKEWIYIYPGGGHGSPLQYSFLENPEESGGLQSMGSKAVGHN